ncbi:MAG: hypothetical protein ACOYJG_11410 [Prevotella sp.]
MNVFLPQRNTSPIAYWRLLTSGTQSAGTWHPLWWHLAPVRLALVSTRQ